MSPADVANGDAVGGIATLCAGSEPPVRGAGRPRPCGYGIGSLLCVALMISVLTLRFLSLSLCYPYYSMWDMDIQAVEGTMAIQGETIPVSNLGHPSFGTYLLHTFSHKIAYSLGIVSILAKEQLATCLSPTTCVVELTSYLRLHSPFVAMGIVLCLWAAVLVLFRPSGMWGALLLLALGTHESLALHATMIRSELYAVFYWSGAVVLLALAAKTGRSGLRTLCLLSAGALLGLCFFTKIQALFYVAAAPLLFLLMLAVDRQRWRDLGTPVARAHAVVVCLLTLLSGLAFVGLLHAARNTTIPDNFMTFARQGYATQGYALLLIAAVAGLFGCQCVMAAMGTVPARAFRLSSFATLLFAGFLASLLCHFLLYADPTVGFTYLLYDFKIAFTRNNDFQKGPLKGTFSYYTAALGYFVQRSPLSFALYAFSLLLLLLGRIFRLVSVPKRLPVLALLLSALCMANVLFGVRARNPRDLLMVEALLGFVSLAYLTLVARYATRQPILLRVLALTLVLVLVVINVAHSTTMVDRLDSNFNRYLWREAKWYPDQRGKSFFSKFILLPKDKALAKEPYLQDRTVLAPVARRHHEIRRTVDFVFKNQRIDLKNVGVLVERFPVWTADLSWRFASFPAQLQGALVIDACSLPLERDLDISSLKSKYVSWDVFGFHGAPGKESTLTVLGRPDLHVLMFVTPEDHQAVKTSGLITPAFLGEDTHIVVANGQQTQEFLPWEVDTGADINAARLTQPGFFVISPNLSAPLAAPKKQRGKAALDANHLGQ